MDLWSSKTTREYLGISCTGVTEDNEPFNAFLTLRHTQGRHTGAATFAEYKSVVKDWNIINKSAFSSSLPSWEAVPSCGGMPSTDDTDECDDDDDDDDDGDRWVDLELEIDEEIELLVSADGEDQKYMQLKSASIVASNSISATTASANGSETRAILFADDGSHRSWVLKSLISPLKLKTVAVENISTRVFKKKEASQPEMTKTVEMQVRGTWKGAPKITLIALESDHIADSGPYIGSEFARSLWIQNEKMADDRFEMAHGEEDPIGILVGMDQMFQIMSNEAAIQRCKKTPCATRWNSEFDSVKCVMDQHEDKLHSAMKKLKLELLHEADRVLLKEYLAIMSPLAKYLDVLQLEEREGRESQIKMLKELLLLGPIKQATDAFQKAKETFRLVIPANLDVSNRDTLDQKLNPDCSSITSKECKKVDEALKTFIVVFSLDQNRLKNCPID
ncbi:Uncharacterized protein APZ42_032965 [Daphnia magna]|uniref:Uncharacterized protein n=1 Tax=Daphnia magna TaxID=35525 RepID=A0A164LIB7_9CRUS|nr:Uncharacterized protein APZ42_032965 [Daphnia magna]